ncbi:MAG: thioredoxin family protein [Planctomycetaceae bacterium]|jgi:thiol:disulfide interchange protein|nr:thioredoxin family protein [Planctomycetaceae bacterium]
MMRFRCLAVLILLYGLAAVSLPVQAQPGGLYDLDSPDSASFAPKNYVTLTGQFTGKHLVIEAKIAPDWHLYSVTQPDGGAIRSTFTFDLPELTLQEIRPVAEPHVNSNAVGFTVAVDLEEHDNAATWIFTFQNDLPKDQIIKGKLDGQVCQSGEGGTCIPLTVPFEAEYNAGLDINSLLGQVAKIKERFVFRTEKTTPEILPKDFTPDEIVPVAGFSTALLYAFLGGIILNFMPCVLPVIGLKILSFFEQAGKSRSKAFVLNLCYSFGILTVFFFLAFLSLGLSILFTFDLFNIIMACVVFVMALSLMDIWTLSAPNVGSGKITSQEGITGAFFKGIMTTLLAIPCGAPLLSPAVNWADMQIRSGNMPQVFLMYGMIALGMASPYLIIGAFPELLRFLPKPGEWMETFKKTMGFLLLFAVVWILYFVQLEKLLPAVTLLFALWFACWLAGRNQLYGRMKTSDGLIGLLVVFVTILFSFQLPYVPNVYTLESAMKFRLDTALQNTAAAQKVNKHQGFARWQPYTAAALEKALQSGKTVAVDFTADWCVNCKFLEATVLNSEPVVKLLDEKQIVTLTADCTRRDEAHKESIDLLKQLGPEQVPVLAVFEPKNPQKPKVLRGFYTQKTLLDLFGEK